MYAVFFEDNNIFVDIFNTSCRSYQHIPWNCNDTILGGQRREEPTAEGREKKYPGILYGCANLSKALLIILLWNRGQNELRKKALYCITSPISQMFWQFFYSMFLCIFNISSLNFNQLSRIKDV